MTTRKLWIGFIAVMVISFSVLLYFGREIYTTGSSCSIKSCDTGWNSIIYGSGYKRRSKCMAIAWVVRR